MTTDPTVAGHQPSAPCEVQPGLKVHVLGCSGSIGEGRHTSSFLVDGRILIDAGTGVGELPLPQMCAVSDVFITHSHLDHIAGLPLLADATAARRLREPLRVHALPETIAALRAHMFNGIIWPDFSRLPSAGQPMLTFHPLEVGQSRMVADCEVLAMPARHVVPTVGYAVRRAGQPEAPWWVCSGDTAAHPPFWQRLNQMNVAALVVETAFSNREQALAQLAMHLTPDELARMLDLLAPHSQFPLFIFHTKPAEAVDIMREINRHAQRRHAQNLPGHDIRWLSQGHLFEL